MKFIAVLIAVLAFASLPLLAQPIITNEPVSRTVWAGGSVTFSVSVSGTEPFTCQWLFHGNPLQNNIITTVAGGQLFDGQMATNAILNTPQGSAMDAAGNLFIADSGNNVIRKVGTGRAAWPA